MLLILYNSLEKIVGNVNHCNTQVSITAYADAVGELASSLVM
jgi:hypothetical protein